jgi:hypothetical protein
LSNPPTSEDDAFSWSLDSHLDFLVLLKESCPPFQDFLLLALVAYSDWPSRQGKGADILDSPTRSGSLSWIVQLE